MSESPSSRPWVALLAGAVLGAVGGLLLAPRSGRESRRKLSRWLKTWEASGKEGGNPVRKRADSSRREAKNNTGKSGDRFS